MEHGKIYIFLIILILPYSQSSGYDPLIAIISSQLDRLNVESAKINVTLLSHKVPPMPPNSQLLLNTQNAKLEQLAEIIRNSKFDIEEIEKNINAFFKADLLRTEYNSLKVNIKDLCELLAKAHWQYFQQHLPAFVGILEEYEDVTDEELYRRFSKFEIPADKIRPPVSNEVGKTEIAQLMLRTVDAGIQFFIEAVGDRFFMKEVPDANLLGRLYVRMNNAVVQIIKEFLMALRNKIQKYDLKP